MNRSIAFIHERYPFGGAEKVTTLLSSFFAKEGYRIHIIAFEFLEVEIENNVSYNQLPDATDINSLKNLDFIIETINKLSIDIFIVPVLNLKHIDLIKSKTSCRLIYTHHGIPMWEATNKYITAKKRGESSLLKKLEWIIIQKPKYDLLKLHYKRFKKAYRKTYECFDLYVTLTESYKNQISTLLDLDANNNKIISISNPLSNPKTERTIKKKKQILYVGRMSYADKRVDRIIKIWSRLWKEFNDWELILVGDGPEKDNLIKLASELDISKINFVGFKKDVTPYYRDGSIICLTSTFEGWGLVLSEAQSYGVIPVAYNCSAGVSEIISPSGVNGILIDCFNEDDFVSALQNLMEDEMKREQFKVNVLKKSETNSIENIGKKWAQIFDSLIC